ncbi:MAG: sugar phosphate isomerase/epimerase [Verrucomicrobia bacterium]|nr:sugar phosphate isomerase/epimerase [Verrucomicrobiota bacterium]
MNFTTRRRFAKTLALAACMPAVFTARAADKKSAAKISLGFSLYGMKSLPLAEALRVCAEIGYDCVEFSLMPGYATEPKQLSAAQRKELRQRLTDSKLTLPALMDNLSAAADDKAHAANLEKIKAAAELAHALVPDNPPLLETVLGGKPAEWEQIKDRMAARVKDWADTATKGKFVVAVKAHVGSAVNTPERLLWLQRQVNSPALKLAYDFSHFQLAGLALADTFNALIGESVFIHVKDSRGVAGKFEFVLPGEGTIDYAEYGRLLAASRYRGPVVVEVSGQVFNKPGYDPIAAAKRSYAHLSEAFAKARGRGK